MFWTIILLICVFLALIVLTIYFFSWTIGLIRARGVPFVALSRKKIATINKLIKLNPEDRVVDLGCGDGRVLRIFEQQGVKDLTGYEVNFCVYLLAKIKNRFLQSKAKVYLKNFQKADLSNYNVIFCYLMDYYVNLPVFKKKLDEELKPGSKVISYAFEIKNWHKPEIIYTNDENKNLGRIFVYKI